MKMHPEQKLWLKELELIAEDNDFLQTMLSSLQTEQKITQKYDDRICLFYNHFQYFIQQTHHLKQGLVMIEKQDDTTERRYAYIKEEINCLTHKFDIFKANFKTFIRSLTGFNRNVAYR